MKEITKLKIKRRFTLLWTEFKVLLEYLIRMPFIEFKNVFKELWKLIKKPVLIFYLIAMYTAYLILNIDKTSKPFLFGMFLLTFITFIWMIASHDEHWKFYRGKYFKPNSKGKSSLENNK